MGMKYEYDESGIHFVYFLLSMLLLILLPSSWKVVSQLKRHRLSRAKVVQCRCGPCYKKAKLLRKSARSLFGYKRVYFLLAGYVSLALGAWYVWRYRVVEKIQFDPFEILGVSFSASERQIKQAYRLMSLKYHPDKVRDVDKETAQNRFVLISKAYKALTDPISKRNYELYGNPDGPSTSTNEIGIALPAWLVDSKNLSIVLGIYGFAFMVALPYWIGKWWYSSGKYAKNGVLYVTMALFYRDFRENFNVKRVIELLSAAIEFKDELPWRPTESAAVPALFNSLKERVEQGNGEKLEPSSKYTAPYCVKAFCLLQAHLSRMDLNCQELEQDRQFVVSKSLTLVAGLIQICIARGWVHGMKVCLSVSQLICQALPEHALPLAQLPHVTEELAKEFRNRKRVIKSVRDFLALAEDEQRIAMAHASQSELEDIVKVATSIPAVEVVSVRAAVLGYDEVICNSVVTLTVTLRLASGFKGARDQGAAAVSKDPECNIELDEDGNVVGEGVQKSQAENTLGPVHAPHLPMDKYPAWWVVVTDEDDAFVAAPSRVTGVGADSTVVAFQFQAPSKPCTLKYTVAVKADFVVGYDLVRECKFKVVSESAVSAADVEKEWAELSDEEDAFNL